MKSLYPEVVATERLVLQCRELTNQRLRILQRVRQTKALCYEINKALKRTLRAIDLPPEVQPVHDAAQL